MRKRIVGQPEAQQEFAADQPWLDLRQIAAVEVTSEDSRFPVESVFEPGQGPGWRASEPGEQRIRLVFDQPLSLRRIQLRFHELEIERTQEFTLCWSPPEGKTVEIVRQQWNFSPSGSTTEIEEYRVNLEAVAVVELSIQPGLGRPDAVASLASWRLA
ncbi:MAG: carbohydrate-binding protein [Bryobacterales bacterium]|nr:carbohydrate-binding protein [Bryobacterales bacterium]